MELTDVELAQPVAARRLARHAALGVASWAFAELGEVGASAAAAASTAAAAAASAASAAAPTESPRHRRGPSALGRASSASIQSRLSEVAVVVGPCTPTFRRLRWGRSRPRRPLFLIWHRFLPTYWDFESLALVMAPRPKMHRCH